MPRPSSNAAAVLTRGREQQAGELRSMVRPVTPEKLVTPTVTPILPRRASRKARPAATTTNTDVQVFWTSALTLAIFHVYIPPFTCPTRTVWYALRRVHAYRILIGAYDPDVVIKSRLEGAPPAGSGFEVDELHLHLEKADGLSTACPCLPGTKSHQVRKLCLCLWMCL